jgi:DNA polymerase-4
VTARKLREIGITRLVDLRTAEEAAVQQAVGSSRTWLVQLSWGNDPRPVEPDRPRKSVGSENTFAHDLRNLAAIQREVAEMAEHCADWLLRHALFARTVTLKVRYADFTTVTRSASAPVPVADRGTIVARAVALLARTEAGARPVRLLGVSVHNLGADQAPAVRSRPAPPWLPFPDVEAPNG